MLAGAGDQLNHVLRRIESMSTLSWEDAYAYTDKHISELMAKHDQSVAITDPGQLALCLRIVRATRRDHNAIVVEAGTASTRL